MECGSEFVYMDEQVEDVEVDFIKDQWDNSQNEENTSMFGAPVFSSPAPQVLPPPPPPPQIQAPFPLKRKKRVKIAGTNVISGEADSRSENDYVVDFGTLAEGAQLSTGDPIFCTSCKGVFSNVSKVTKSANNNETKSTKEEAEEATNVWTCEFCGQENHVFVEPEEIPTEQSVDYILAPPTELVKGSDETAVIFVIDISGSMCVSYEVAGKVSLKGNERQTKMAQEVDSFTEKSSTGLVADQWLPNEKRDITYVTRLQCVQAAISNELENMHKEHPNKRACIITFNHEVTIIGDGTTDPMIIAGDKLTNFEQLFQTGEKCLLKKGIKETKDGLLNKLFSIQENGSTALGPALVTALGVSSKVPGSKIVICTDGLSNVGLGSMDDLSNDEQKDEVAKFYQTVGLQAQAQGTVISIISIKGSDCSIENIGQLSELTAGTVDRVSPLDITKNFQSILSLPVIATHVNATMLVHKGLEIAKDEEQAESSNSLIKDIGNVTKESGVTFEYFIRDNYKKEELSALKELPFQVQIRFTKLDGMKCIRVITKVQPITFDRKVAEESANIAVMGMNAVQKSAQLASKGDYTGARFFNLANKKAISRAAKSPVQQQQFSKWSGFGKDFESTMVQKQQQEISEGLDLDVEEEDFMNVEKETEVQEKKPTPSQKKELTNKYRRNQRDDTTSTMLYNMKSGNVSKYK